MYKNKILAELIPYLENMQKCNLDTDLEIMRQFNPIPEEIPQGMLIENIDYQRRDGKGKLRIYKPKVESQESLPALYWIHGGGYVLGDYTGDDRICSKLASEVPCIVVSVDYRLAPEYPYPAGLNDCYDGLLWLYHNSEELGIIKEKIGIGGPSAGGGLTAALALLVRDKKEIEIVFQMPLYPMIDDKSDLPSALEITKEVMPNAWNKENNQIAWNMYLGDMDRENIPYYAAPYRALDLSGLPPTYTCVGQMDPFRDETINYVQRLAQCGVSVEFNLYPGCYHGFDGLGDQTAISRKANEYYVDVLKVAFEKKEL